MGKTALCIVMLELLASNCAGIRAYSPVDPPQSPEGVHMSRVRSEDPAIAAAIANGTEHSPTFRRLVEDIGATDGLVYVMEGRCGQGIRACLHMSLELAGPNRLLRVLVNFRRPPGCEIVVSIGHELQHALEALRNPRIRDRLALYSFFHQIGQKSDARKFETPEAFAVGVAVDMEICGRARALFRSDARSLDYLGNMPYAQT